MAGFVFQPAPSQPDGTSRGLTPIPMPALPEKPALVTLFEAEESHLLGFTIGLVGQRAVAEEIVQEAFLRLHQIWSEVEHPRPWLYRSVRNLALNHLRDHRRETFDEKHEAQAKDCPPDELLGRLEAIGMVRMLVSEMTQEDRELIRLKYHEDLKYVEISRRTGVSVGNVGYKLHHLLKGLADSLRHLGVEGSQG
jgi:RNA polymerase sigma factor (sigma-70 family)